MRYKIFRILLLCFPLLFGLPSVAQMPPLDDSTLRAVFIERFTRFIDWPRAALSLVSPDKFVICLLSDDEYSKTLTKVYAQKKILDRTVAIKIIDIEQVSQCHVLYLLAAQRSKLHDILSRVKDLPVLTIGNAKGYAHQGVLINFFQINNQLRFEINEKAMRHAGFQVSYKLLAYAVIVESMGK